MTRSFLVIMSRKDPAVSRIQQKAYADDVGVYLEKTRENNILVKTRFCRFRGLGYSR